MYANTWNPVGNVVLTNGRAPFGCLLNMTGGFPVVMFGRKWLSTEALYQACRYDDRKVHKEIWEAHNAFVAKQVAYKYIDQTRDNWDDVKVPVMFECLRLKYCQHDIVRNVIEQATGRHIIEQSRKDDFWGAIPQPDGYLRGKNTLGRLWTFIGEGGDIVVDYSLFPDGTRFAEFLT